MKRLPMVLVTVAMTLAACGGSSSSGGGSAQISPPPNSELLTAGTLTIASDVSYPPQESMKEGTNTPEGFDIDIGDAIGKKLGLKVVWQNQGFDTIIDGLIAKKYDIIISAVTINDERKQKVDFVPYFRAGESFVVTKGSSKHPKQLPDLCGLNVAVEKGTSELDEANGLNKSGGTCASNQVKVQAFDKDTDALRELKKGSVDVHFTDSPVAGFETRHDSGLALSGGVIEIAPEGIVVRKGDTAMEDPISKAFKAIEDDGTYDSILKKWGLQDGDIRKTS